MSFPYICNVAAHNAQTRSVSKAVLKNKQSKRNKNQEQRLSREREKEGRREQDRWCLLSPRRLTAQQQRNETNRSLNHLITELFN